jgi:hypothetical protein
MCWKYDWHLHNYIYYQAPRAGAPARCFSAHSKRSRAALLLLRNR